MQSRALREKNVGTIAAWLCCVVVFVFQAGLEASHFRFGHLSWQRAAGNTNSLVVEITVVEAWRKDTSGPGSLTYTIDHDGTTFSSQGAAVIGTLTDIAGDEYEIYSHTVTHTFPSNGVYTVTSSQTFRLVDLVNAPATPVTLQLTMDLRASNSGTALTTNPIILQLPVDTANSVRIPLVDPDNDPISVRFATVAESGIANIPTVGENQMSVTSAGVINWNTTGGTVGQRFAVQLAVEENHPGFTTTGRVPLEFMVELVNVVANQPPACTGPSGTLNAQVGTPFAVSVSGSDPEGRALGLSAQQLPPGAILTPGSGTTNASPTTVQLQWVPGLDDLGRSYPVTLVFTDDGGLQASCGFTISVSSILPLPNFDLASINSSGTGSGDGGAYNPAISRSARYVAFASAAANLVTNDNNGTTDVFLRDRGLTNTTLVSATSAGAAGNGASRNAVISSDGRFVAFESDASDLVAGDNNGATDVFIYDALSNHTVLVSVNAAGTGSGNALSFAPQFSADGRVVAFVSAASDLAANDNNGTADVFVRRLDSGTTLLVSANTSGQSGAGGSASPVISTNGRFVAFTSTATDLVTGDTNNTSDIFWRDLALNQTRLVSVNQAGGVANGYSYNPTISSSGFRVAFASAATDLVSLTDSNQQSDIFLRDMSINVTAAVSRNAGGTAMGDRGSSTPVFSPDGKGLLFVSIATDLVSGDANGEQDVFLFRFLDPGSGDTPVLPGTLPNATVEAISLNNGGNGTGNGASGVTAASLSEDLRYVAFVSAATDLVDGGADGNGVVDVFIRDRTAGITKLVSYDPNNRALGNGASYTPFLSADGDVVVFATEAGNLAANDQNGAADIVSTALTNNVPASVALTTAMLVTEESPAGVDFPVVVHVSNLGDAVVEHLQVLNEGTGAFEGVSMAPSQGTITAAGSVWNVGTLPPGSAARLTMTLRGTVPGQLALSSTVLPPVPGATIEGRTTARRVVNILPPLNSTIAGPVSYGDVSDGPWTLGGATKRFAGAGAMVGVGQTTSGSVVRYEFDPNTLGAAAARVGLVIPNHFGTVTIEAIDSYGRRLGDFDVQAVPGTDRFYGISSSSGITAISIRGNSPVAVKELWLTVESGVPVPPGLGLWARGEATAAGLVGVGYELDGTAGRTLGDTVGTGSAGAVEFWVRPAVDLSGATEWTPLVVTTVEGGDLARDPVGLDVYYFAGALSFGVPNGQGREVVQARLDLSARRWYHVAGVVGDGWQQIFVDGQSVATRELSSPAVIGKGRLQIGGAQHAGVARRFAGTLDEVSLYDRALSGVTIAAIHDQKTAGKVKPQLSIRRDGDANIVEWPAFFPGYQVHGRAQIGPEQNWNRWPAHPPIVDGLYRVSIPAMSGYRYFQLKLPD